MKGLTKIIAVLLTGVAIVSYGFSTVSANIETAEVTYIELPEIEVKKKPINLGNFKLTAYCSCHKCCGKWAEGRPIDENGEEIVIGAIGERLKPNYSIAVDPKVIPYGTEVEINGNIYKAQDCGGGIIDNEIDVYFDNHSDALIFGVQYADVYLRG